MYFGNKFEPSLNRTELAKIGSQINGDIIKVELGDLKSEPKNYRANQKKFWSQMQSSSVSFSESSNSISFS